MSTLQFLADLKNLGLDLWVEHGQLCFRAQKGVMTQELKDQLKARKQEVVTLLQNTEPHMVKNQNGLVKTAAGGTHRLSFAQRGLWFLQSMTDAAVYHLPMGFCLLGELDTGCLVQACEDLVGRHESLRTQFILEKNEPLAEIVAQPTLPFHMVDLGHWPKPQRHDLAITLSAAFAQKPFQLDRAPLYRVLLLKLDHHEHVLVIDTHHLVCDGWSLQVLFKDLGQLYSSYVLHEAADLVPIEYRYADYVQWEQQRNAQLNVEEQLNWWQARLNGLTGLLLPTDRPRPGVITLVGSNERFVVHEQLVAGLKRLGEREGASLFMVLLTAFKCLLMRYSGTTDVAIGSALGNREFSELEPMVGLFVNMLTMRNDLSGNPSFIQALGRIRTTVLEAFAHKDVSFERVVERCRTQPDPGLHPLFQVQMVFFSLDVQEPEFAELLVEPFDWGSTVARKDITLVITERKGCLQGNLEYNTNLFTQSTMAALARQLLQLLATVADKPETCLWDISLLSREEQKQLFDINRNMTSYPRGKTLCQLFEEVALNDPERVALCCDDKELSYGVLHGQTRVVAGLLYERGVRPGDLVGICLDQGPERIVATLAIVALGAAYVPLDPDYPAERLRFMVEDTQMSLLIGEVPEAENLPLAPGQILQLDAIVKNLPLQNQRAISQLAFEPNLPAYVMYTSGSSGRPKGVVVPHAGVARLVKETDYLTIRSQDVLIQAASFSFDAATLEVWGALLNGACLVLPQNRDVDSLAELLVGHQVSICWLTAQLFHLMVDRHLQALSGVKQLLAGGEALSVEHVNRYLAQFPNHRLINGYGPTENTTFTCCCDLSLHGVAPFSAPIGSTISNTDVYVLDQRLRPVPIGVVGQLYAGGDGLAQGYNRRPTETALRFIPHPFSGELGKRLYATGDRVRFIRGVSGPILEFVARLDRQIKLRGFRIEPGEIEHWIKCHPLVSQAVVGLRETERGEPTLVAWATLVDGGSDRGLERKILSWLADKLAEYMMPQVLMVLDDFPMNPNGKLDTSALPHPDFSGRAEVSAPKSTVEQLLAGIWSNILGCVQVGLEDNFFELGGHSLLANQVMGAITDTFEVNLPVRTLFECATLGALAHAVEEQIGSSNAVEKPPIEAGPVQTGKRRFPLSFAQERLWFFDRFEPGSAMYSVPIAVRLLGHTRKEVLLACFKEIMARHEVLRTRFITVDGVAHQEVLEECVIDLVECDLISVPEPQREEECLRRITEQAHIPFVLEEGYLIRLVLYRLSSKEHVLLMNLHHIVSDGWSLKVLFHELAALYAAFARGEPSPLSALPLQYGDFVVWQRQWLRGEWLEKQFAYWQERLAGAPTVLKLPTDFPRPQLQTFRGGGVSFTFSQSTTGALHDLCRNHNVTPFMALIAVYGVLLSRYSSQDDVLIGTPIANREHPRIQGLIGFFLNTLVMRLNLGGTHGRSDWTFVTLLAQVRATALEAYAHQELPYEQLVHLMQPERDLRRPPLIQAGFSIDTERSDTEACLPDLVLKHQTVDYRIAKVDLNLGMGEYEGCFYGSFGYNVDLFSSATVQRMAHHLCHLLDALLAAPHQKLNLVSCLSNQEKALLLESWHKPGLAHPDQTPLAMFTDRVAQNPHDPAALYQGHTLSYAQLQLRAENLASHLLELGVKPGDLVGLGLANNLALVVGQVAVLMTGAAFVLLPSTPPERLRTVLGDAGCRALVTSSSLLIKLGELLVTPVLLDGLGVCKRGDQGNAVPNHMASPEMPAYMMYTSGSTGQPKGSLMTHRGLANLMAWNLDYFNYCPGQRASKLSNPGFDGTIWETWPFLAAGVTIDVAEPDLLKNPADLRDWLVDRGIHYCYLPTTVLELVLKLVWPKHFELKYLVTAGEALTSFPPVDLPFTLLNSYGPTECSVAATLCQVLPQRSGDRVPEIGAPVPGVSLYVLNAHLQPVPPGVIGQIFLAGVGLAMGYWKRSAQTAAQFIPNPFGMRGERLYATGDLAIQRLDDRGQLGRLEFVGRIGSQIKLRGYRIELAEIEHQLRNIVGIAEAVVLVDESATGERRLMAYLRSEVDGLEPVDIRQQLQLKLPDYMVPAVFVVCEQFPLIANGKVDRGALADMGGWQAIEAQTYAPPENSLEQKLAAIWCEVLEVAEVGVQTNFFEMGGHSMMMARVQTQIEYTLGFKPDLVDLFQYPTISSLAKHFTSREQSATVEVGPHRANLRKQTNPGVGKVAIIGFAGCFPAAPDVQTFWQNLCLAVPCIRPLEDKHLHEMGLDPQSIAKPNYVKRAACLHEVDMFDAAFFGYNPREAAVMDPQQRIFLEQAWTALEHAGYDPETPLGIGLFAGCGHNGYLFHNLAGHEELSAGQGGVDGIMGNEAGFMATRVSYKLNLKGPSINLQTACSTSLVAVHLAAQSLLRGECDMVLAGGVSVQVPNGVGYLYQEGLFLSPDGFCRAFDKNASGTVRGDGAGLVVLKRLDDALGDSDTVYAVLRGSAVNNDGSSKVGYTAPSVEGQAAVIREALDVAGVNADTISYVETHGAGTPLGDPIEIKALGKAFGPGSGNDDCALGAVKTNVGHLDVAAGVTGLIKAVLALHHRQIPPTLNFVTPNPQIDFHQRFYVNTQLLDWQARGEHPRRAGVSSFGLGGTNAHAVLEEAPLPRPTDPSSTWQLLPLSARNRSALKQLCDNLSEWLNNHPHSEIADVAHTLQVGRHAFPLRQAVVASHPKEAMQQLEQPDLSSFFAPDTEPSVVFMFPGYGGQYRGMTKGLYSHYPLFKKHLDQCFAFLETQLLGYRLKDELFGGDPDQDEVMPIVPTLPAIFSVSYALAQLLMSWGIQPRALVGHSLGEYVAATVADVFSLKDALALVVERGKLLNQLPPGANLAVFLGVDAVKELLEPELSLAVVNGLDRCLISGSIAAIERLASTLSGCGVAFRRLPANQAFHSYMLEPVMEGFARRVAEVSPRQPRIPFVSNLSGTWIKDSQATDPHYWAQHLRHTIHFSDDLLTLFKEENSVLLEVGPGCTLSDIAKLHPARPESCHVFPTTRRAEQDYDDCRFLLESLGSLWGVGIPLNWNLIRGQERRRRLAIPTYPFQRKRYWIEPASQGTSPNRQHLKVVISALGEMGHLDPNRDIDLEQLASMVHAEFFPQLETPEHERPELAIDFAAPQTAVQRQLSQIWEECMGLSRVGINDSFFALGGDSLLATRIVVKARALFSLELPLIDSFKRPTIAAYADYIEEAQAQAENSLETVIPKPCQPLSQGQLSFCQERLWFLDRLMDDKYAYNLPNALSLEGELNLTAVQRALVEIVLRHDILRACFPEQEGLPHQVISPMASLNPVLVDLSLLPSAQRDAVFKEQAVHEARQPFDLQRGPLFRVVLYRFHQRRHILYLNVHHIVFDALSFGLFFSELATLYNAFVVNRSHELPALTMHYGDFVSWQRDEEREELYQQQQNWWLQNLDGEAALQLPLDYVRPRMMRSNGDIVVLGLSPELNKDFLVWCSDREITPYMGLLSVFAVLLWRYCGQDRFRVGTPFSNRTQLETQNLIGFFVNTLVLELELAGDLNFGCLTERVCNTTLDAFAHADLPFERLVERLLPNRDLSRSALFQVMFSLENVSAGLGERGLSLKGLKTRFLDVGFRVANFDLGLAFSRNGNHLSGAFTYNCDLFSRATIERLAHHFVVLMERLIDQQETPLSDVSCLTESERQLLLYHWNKTARRLAGATAFHPLFEAQVYATPQNPAVIHDVEVLTYDGLNSQANQLAHYLRQCGLRSGQPVAVCLPACVDWVVAALAVFKAGGIYLPMDPNLPQERRAIMLADAQPPMVVSHRGILEGEVEGTHEILLDDHGLELYEFSNENLNLTIDGRFPAYIVYTSGSTGTPKGVCCSHGAMVNHNLYITQLYGLNQRDRVLQLCSIGFDVSFEELFPTLLAGAAVVLCPHQHGKTPLELQTLITTHGITVLNPPTAIWFEWVRYLHERDSQVPDELRVVIPGGDKLEPSMVELWWDLVGERIELYNGYGPAETTISSALHYINKRPGKIRAIPVGRPIANMRCYVVDAQMRLVPIGVMGELLFGGVGLATGYLNKPALTAAAFVPDPFSNKLGERLYHSGDWVRYRDQGELEFHGRLDRQVKIRGIRLEPAEVEQALRSCSEVEDAMVSQQPDPNGQMKLVAWLVAGVAGETGQLKLIEQTHLALKKKLPSQMIPARLVVIARLPLNANGKLDRQALPDPTWDVEDFDQGQPSNPPEALMVDLWASVLNRDRVGVTHDFFELGGHSLLAVRVMSRIADAFGVSLPVKDLFENPTVRALAQHVAVIRKGSGPAREAILPVQATDEGVYPLSSAQERLWFLGCISPTSPEYNLPFGLTLRGFLDVDLLARCFLEIQNRHSVLRTLFETTQGMPRQRIAEYPQPVVLIDLSGLKPSLGSTTQAVLIRQETHRPFNLHGDPLLRIYVFRLGQWDHHLLVNQHHTISDGWSIGLFYHELAQIYLAYQQGTAPTLSSPTIQYLDYAIWQKSLPSEQNEADFLWWEKQLAGVPQDLNLVCDHPRSALWDWHGQVERFQLQHASEVIFTQCRNQGVTPFMYFLAAFAVLLSRYADQEELCIGTNTANRDRLELEEVMGFFANTLVMPVSLKEDPSFTQLLRRVRSMALDVYAHQDTPFEQLVERLSPKRDLSRNSLVQVMFSLSTNSLDPTPVLPGLECETLSLVTDVVRFDLSLDLYHDQNKMEGAIQYNTSLFHPHTIKTMVGHFLNLVTCITREPNLPVSKLSLLDDAERQRLLRLWQMQNFELPYVGLAQLFEQTVRENPDWEALIWQGESLNFQELNRQANGLAKQLLAMGAGPETFVAVCYPRHADVVTAIWAILKTGAAYVPLDPSYPQARLRYMLGDCGAGLCVVHPDHQIEAEGVDLLPWKSARIPYDDEPMCLPSIDPQYAGYAIYTSGSMGRPKGVVVSQGALVNLARALAERFYSQRQNRRVTLNASISFDASVQQLVQLVLGHCLCVVPNQARASGPDMINYIKDVAAEVLDCTPTLLNTLLRAGLLDHKLHSLRLILVGGEALSQTLWKAFSAQSAIKLANMYGLSEAGVDSLTCYADAGVGPHLGEVFRGSAALVMDRRLKLNPVGIRGQLYLAGDGLGRGYSGNPKLTAASFVPHPHGRRGERILATGDLVRINPESMLLEFLGRIDHQVKLYGMRIEPGEISNVLTEHPMVVWAEVVPNKDGRLVGYVVSKPMGPASVVGQLREYLISQLPLAMVPTDLVILKAPPIGPGGKLDVSALADHASKPLKRCPQTSTEKELFSLWCDLLARDDWFIDDNFFDLGGHSLLVARGATQLSAIMAKPFPPRAFFDYPSVAQMAAYVDELREENGPPDCNLEEEMI